MQQQTPGTCKQKRVNEAGCLFNSRETAESHRSSPLPGPSATPTASQLKNSSETDLLARRPLLEELKMSFLGGGLVRLYYQIISQCQTCFNAKAMRSKGDEMCSVEPILFRIVSLRDDPEDSHYLLCWFSFIWWDCGSEKGPPKTS